MSRVEIVTRKESFSNPASAWRSRMPSPSRAEPICRSLESEARARANGSTWTSHPVAIPGGARASCRPRV